MEIGRMSYSYRKVRCAIDMVKAVNWTVKRKNERGAKAYELSKIWAYCHDNVHSFLFEEDMYLRQYRNAAHDYKNYTSKELNAYLKDCKMYIQWELRSILNDMVLGEVDTTD